jgi:hypothetical protein
MQMRTEKMLSKRINKDGKPSELSEQIQLVRILRASGVLFCAVPNGGWRDRRGAMMLKASGVERGVPDLLIFDRPPLMGDRIGTALELKREGPMRKSAVSKYQRQWLEDLNLRGWNCVVGYGYRHAIELLKKAGYELR